MTKKIWFLENYYCPAASEALITLYAENQKDFKTQA
jgi:hypothetical protein